MTLDEAIKHCDDYITSMNKYADTGNIGWWLEFYHTVLNGFRELKALKAQSTDAVSREAVIDYAKDTCLDLDKDEDTEIFCDEIKAMPSVTEILHSKKIRKWKEEHY